MDNVDYLFKVSTERTECSRRQDQGRRGRSESRILSGEWYDDAVGMSYIVRREGVKEV